MKMAKASAADLSMAMDLCGALDALAGWPAFVPEPVHRLEGEDDAEPFDRHNREQCVRVLGHLLDLAGRASLMRVVWGCAVVLDPRNQCVDPDADTIEHHPDTKRAKDCMVLRPLDQWLPENGSVLWWPPANDQAPWVGCAGDAARPSTHSLWTPILVPTFPSPGDASPTSPGPQSAESTEAATPV